MKHKPIIYVASPYTKGDSAINVHFQMRMFNDLMNDGIVWPITPLWTHFQHIAFPRPYQDWIEYDLALIHLYDGCLRLSVEYSALNYSVSESSGADGEVAKFKELGKPIFVTKEALYTWVEEAN